jgi:hypothetical protein
MVMALRRDVNPEALQPDGLLGTALFHDSDVVLDYTDGTPGVRVSCSDPDDGTCMALPTCDSARTTVDPPPWMTRFQSSAVRVGLVARVREFWRYRRILWFFASRRIKERYESTTLGMFWLFARPLIPTVVSSAIFGHMLGIKSDGVPYFLFFLTGSSCWRLFDRSLIAATRSLDQNRGLIKKVYFPRLVAPIASTAPSFIEFAIMLALTLVVGGYYYYREGKIYLRLGFLVLLAPVAAGLAILLALAVGFVWLPSVQQGADGLDLWTQIKVAHWNVKGPSFIGLHELFDKVADHPSLTIFNTLNGILSCGLDQSSVQATKAKGINAQHLELFRQK